MQLEKQVKDVEKFYKATDVQQNDCKLKGREKSRRASEDMHEEIMRNFNKILNEASASTSSITIIRDMPEFVTLRMNLRSYMNVEIFWMIYFFT